MSRKPKCPRGADTDMRIGVTKAEHELLDLIASSRADVEKAGGFYLIEAGAKAAGAALRADPSRGMGSRRRDKALEAAALLLLAVEYQDASA